MLFNIISSVTFFCLAFSAAALPSGSDVSPLAKALAKRNGKLPGRELRASNKVAMLATRSDVFVTRRSVYLDYAEDENVEGAHIVAATVHAESKSPIMLLEEVEHLVESIDCRPDSISVRLLPHVAEGTGSEAWLDLASGLIITSHYGCNAWGERKLFRYVLSEALIFFNLPYRVENVTVNENGSLIVLDTKHADWATSFSSLDVQIQRTKELHIYRRHQLPKVRRQEEAASTTVDLPTPSIPAPTATQTANTTSLDVNFPFIDVELPLPGNAGANVHVKCKNCSTFGELDFSFASFSLRDLDENNNDEGWQLGGFFEGGEVNIVAKGLGARVELEVGLSSDGGFDVSLFQVPLLYALSISGIGSVGLTYAPALHFSHALNGTLNFTTGFEIAVPDNSNIFVDLTEPNNSSTSGFDATTVTPVPFQASVDVEDVKLSVALRHQIQIWFNFNNDISAEIGVYLDLPKFGAGFSKKSGVDENCGALATSASENKDVAQRVLKEVLSIEPNVDWGVGVAGDLSWFAASNDFEHEFANGTLSDVDSQCLVFDGSTGAYVDAKEVVSEAKKSNAGQVRVSDAAYLMLALVVAVSALL
ncbi:hypothetical protein P171DRAFT_486938 [Karstenula rhodostoma CBS 690.94]|uniref:GPI anchored protein n=1 Tax=Karstenula rhodostoma CBS 690.94 TaxID=1392251 RepID=A0A9P4PDD8_9PLEO|nr:hypothetical protein P171DRAFT_486938 [Karstenula rhodostoma CBS 690.94]